MSEQDSINPKLLQLVNKIRRAIFKKTLFKTNKNITVSVSGGQDSMFLLLTCYLLQTQLNLTCHLLLCNHFWQKNSFYVTLHLTKSSFLFCLPTVSFVPLTRAFSEQEARIWRHLVTDRASTFYGFDSCIYGHTKSDRVETILFNLIRGAGKRGVISLQWEREHSSFSCNKFYPTLKQLQKEVHLISK